MWEFYSGKVILITGGSGFLGTTLVYRIVTNAPVKHIFLTYRGTRSDLRQKWRQWLPDEYVNKMSDPTLVTVINADITKTDLGIDAEMVRSLEANVNIVIHAASSINLLQSLPKISEVVVGATERVARMSLGFDNLDRFVYVSTAYVNSHLWQESGKIDVKVDEELYPLSAKMDKGAVDRELATTTRVEWAQVHSSGSSPEFRTHDFPWPYAYAKHLSERVVHCMFSDQGVLHKLLIIRPSIIGPAQNYPYPGFSLPMSTPCTVFMAAAALSTSVWARIATRSSNPVNDTTIDEVPVDVVVDRLLLHTANRTSGPVHAVSGELARSTVGEIWRKAMRFRRIPWEPRLIWTNSNWHSPDLHLVARLYVILGTSYHFSDDKTHRLWEQYTELEKTDLQIFNTRSEGYHNLTLRRHQIRQCMDKISRRSFWAQLIVAIFYHSYGLADIQVFLHKLLKTAHEDYAIAKVG